VIAFVILEDVANLKVVVVLMVVDIVALIRGTGNVSIARGITSLRSVRNLVALNG